MLQIFDGAWQIGVRPEADAGMDRLVMFERWLEPEAWREMVVIWSYSYKPAVLQADGFRISLPYRLVLAHPCVARWEQLTGRAPPAPRRRGGRDEGPVGYDEYNEALADWLQNGDVPRLVINEILYDPSIIVDTAGEMVELYNPNPDPVDLSGWRFEDARDGHNFPAGAAVVPAWGYLVVGTNRDARINGREYIDYWYGDAISLHNTSDTLRIIDAAGDLVDEVTYDEGAPWPDGDDGYSFELVDPCADNDDPANWRLAEADFSDRGHTFMTPGAANSVADSSCPQPPEPEPGPDPEPACEATMQLDCDGGGCGAFPACVDDAIANVRVYAQQQAAAGNAERWNCDEPLAIGAQHTDDDGNLCTFQLACVVTLDGEGGVIGLARCTYAPDGCGRISCDFAI